MSLAPGQRLGPFEIVAPLGAGGMGEVYRARDTRLDRWVAVKVLPDELVRDPARVNRFVREAKTASALSHPNIVTIHEIGEAAPADAQDAGSAAPVHHYIAMELVEGRTLREILAARDTPLEGIVGWLAQAAEGLAKAHEAGVIHRDFKPENVMVSRDAYAKVLDFGLAKLLERSEEAQATAAPTLGLEERTREGTVLGTVGYMSPEQVRGDTLDPRSDVFSLGCVLYEAACGERPFGGDTRVDVQHQILHDRPRPIEELNPSVPRALQRLILRCLVKERERRLQSMRDLALELKDIVDDWQHLAPASGASSISGLSGPAWRSPRRVPRWAWAFGGIGVALVAAVGLGLMRAGAGSEGGAGFQTMRITPLTSNGEVVDAAISPDGRYVAYTAESVGRSTLRLLQIATGSDVEVLAQAERIRTVSFSPDGDYLYYTSRSSQVHVAALYQIPVLGGAPRQVVLDVDTGVGPSPDGRRLAFVRGSSQESKSSLVVAELDGSQRVLAVREWPWAYWWDTPPAWSNDGGTIAVPVRLPEGEQVEILAVEGGTTRLISLGKLVDVEGLAWLPDGRTLVLSAKPGYGAFASQIWRLDTGTGVVRRVTNDPNSYRGTTLTADGRSLATIQRSASSDLWVERWREPGTGRRLGVGGRGPIWRVESARGGVFWFLGERTGGLHLWRGRIGEEDLVRMSERPGQALGLSLSEDGRTVLFGAVDTGVPRVIAMDADGSNVRPLTGGAASASFGVVAPDGRWFAYYVPGEGVLRASLAGDSAPHVISPAGFPTIAISPDGERIAYTVTRQREGLVYPALEIAAADGSAVLAHFDIPAELDKRLRWSPDGKTLSYSVPRQGGSDVWRLSLDGRPASKLLSCDGERIFDFDWIDAETLLVSRGTFTRDVVLIRDFQ